MIKTTQSLWVIRDRETHYFWNGFGYESELKDAMTYPFEPAPDQLAWMPFASDVLELRLIERESNI